MIDVALLIILALVTWCVASEGAWGSAFMLINVVMSGLLAMNFFEPVAEFLDGTLNLGVEWSYRWDIVALLGLFAGSVFGIRAALEKLMPTLVLVQPLTFDIVRWICGLATGYVTMAILLTSLHTAPLPREFLGFTPERTNFFSMAPDRQWLGFTQYVSEKTLPNGNIFDGPTYQAGNGKYEYPEDFKAAPYFSEQGRLPIWPSFPIRYASRRDEYAANSGDAAAAASAPTTAPTGPAIKPAF